MQAGRVPNQRPQRGAVDLFSDRRRNWLENRQDAVGSPQSRGLAWCRRVNPCAVARGLWAEWGLGPDPQDGPHFRRENRQEKSARALRFPRPGLNGRLLPANCLLPGGCKRPTLGSPAGCGGPALQLLAQAAPTPAGCSDGCSGAGTSLEHLHFLANSRQGSWMKHRHALGQGPPSRVDRAPGTRLPSCPH